MMFEHHRIKNPAFPRELQAMFLSVLTKTI